MRVKLLLSVAALWLGIAGPAAAGDVAKTSVKSAKTSAPAVKTPVRVEQDYVPRPAIWLLSDDDTKIYLFGTAHMLPPGFKWRSPALDRIVADANELVVETYSPPESEDEFVESLASLMFMDKPSPVLKRVPKSKRAALAKLIGESQLEAELLDNMRTWAVGLMLGMGALLGDYGVDDPSDAPGVEDVLEEAFRKAGKPINSVENPEVVLTSLNSLSEEVQVELLVASLEDVEIDPAELAKTDHYWARGKYEEVAEGDLQGMPPAVFDALLTKRNVAWTEWLDQRLDKPGTILFAVGAAHLAGRSSVQRMLEGRGLKVVRID